MKKILLRDIIIPAGTVFTDAPVRSDRTPGEFVDCVIGLTKNTCGNFTYESNSDELDDWFSDVIKSQEAAQ
jgi:hypothetical protein